MRRDRKSSLLAEQARRTGALLAALSAAAVTSVGIAMAMSGGGETALVEHTSQMVLEPTSTTTTTALEAAGPEVTTTTAGDNGDRAELAALRAEVAAGRSEKAAEQAELVVTSTTSTSTTAAPATTTTTVRWVEVPAPSTTSSSTTTTVPVYGWVEVARFSWDGPLSGPPLREDVTLQGGKLRVSGLTPRTNSGTQKVVWLGAEDAPQWVVEPSVQNTGTVVDCSWPLDCGWYGEWPAGPVAVRLGWRSTQLDYGWHAPPVDDVDVVVEEWRRVG